MNFLLLALTVALSTDTSFRLFNPHATPVAARVCGETVQVPPMDVADHDACGSTEVESPLPLMILEMSLGDDGERQLVVAGAAEACAGVAMRVPSFACGNSTAVAAVPAVDGATYTWTAEGAAIVSGAGTSQVSLAIGDVDVVTVTCSIRTPECERIARGVIAVRPALVIEQLRAMPDPQRTDAVVVTWSYVNAAQPKTQMLITDALDAPVVLSGDARSHTLTPSNGGMRTFEIIGSYAPAIAAQPSAGRRRAVGSTLDIVAVCPTARASTQYEIRGCAFRPRITAPDDVVAGGTFGASVDLMDGQSALWSVENGVINTTSDAGDRVTVRAGERGPVALTVRITSGGCSAAAQAEIPVYQKQCAVPPTASIALVRQECDGAYVEVTFTGKPPFAGMWSDRTTFRTDRYTYVQQIRSAGSHRISELHDSNCMGSASNSVAVASIRPTVTLTDEGCGKLVARFTGTPPFSGAWSDGLKFTTSASEITRSVGAGTWSVNGVTDATCRDVRAQSPFVIVKPPAQLVVAPGQMCDLGWGAYYEAEFVGGEPPYVIRWSDGQELRSVSPKVRVHYPSRRSDFTIEVAEATAAGCPATISNRRTTVAYDDIPYPVHDWQPLCVGDERVYRLNEPLPPGTRSRWRFNREIWGTILSGQNTDQVLIKALTPGSGLICEITTDSGCEATMYLNAFAAEPLKVYTFGVRYNVWSPTFARAEVFFTTDSTGSFRVRERSGREVTLKCFGNECNGTFDSVPGRRLIFDLLWTDCAGPHVMTREVGG